MLCCQAHSSASIAECWRKPKTCNQRATYCSKLERNTCVCNHGGACWMHAIDLCDGRSAIRCMSSCSPYHSTATIKQHTQKHYSLLTCNEESLQHASLPGLVAESSVTLRSQSLRGRHDHIRQAGHLEASNPCARCLQHAVAPTLPRLLWQCPSTLGCPLDLHAGKHLQSGQYIMARRITECKVDKACTADLQSPVASLPQILGKGS